MSLEIKKVYIDTRYKSPDSKSDSDFIIDLPRQFNVPDDVVAYIDDIVLPVSWETINIHNQHFYFVIFYGGSNYHRIAVVPAGNYNGSSFAAALRDSINQQIVSLAADIDIFVDYNYTSNIIRISIDDKRPEIGDLMTMYILDDPAIKGNDYLFRLPEPKSLNEILNIDFVHVVSMPYPYSGYLDLQTIRNLYLVSSALAAYDTVSNWGNDRVIKKIPVKASYNEIIFDNASEGFDYLNVSRRSLRRLDFRLHDTKNRIIDLRRTHWSFSIVFVKK